MSWQTRQLSTFIAAGYMVDGKKGNPALDSAQVLAFDEIERAQIAEAQERSEKESGPGGASFDEKGDIIPEIPKLNPGSFERFLGSAGNPYRWAGR